MGLNIRAVDLVSKFRQGRYRNLPAVLRNPTLSKLLSNASAKWRIWGHQSGEDQIADTPCAYEDPFMDTLFLSLSPRLMFVCHEELKEARRSEICVRAFARPSCRPRLMKNASVIRQPVAAFERMRITPWFCRLFNMS